MQASRNDVCSISTASQELSGFFFLLDPHKPVSTFPPQLWRAQLAVKGQQPAGVVNEGNSINVVTAYAVWKMVGEALGL